MPSVIAKMFLFLCFFFFSYILPVSIHEASAQVAEDTVDIGYELEWEQMQAHDVKYSAPTLDNINDIRKAQKRYEQAITEKAKEHESSRRTIRSVELREPQREMEKIQDEFYRDLIESSLGVTFSDSYWWEMQLNRNVLSEALTRASAIKDPCEAAMDIFFYIQSNIDRLSPSHAVSGFDLTGFWVDQNIWKTGGLVSFFDKIDKRHQTAAKLEKKGHKSFDMMTEQNWEDMKKETLKFFVDMAASKAKVKEGGKKWAPFAVRSGEDAAMGFLFLLNPKLYAGVEATRKTAKTIYNVWQNYESSIEQQQNLWKLQILERHQKMMGSPSQVEYQIKNKQKIMANLLHKQIPLRQSTAEAMFDLELARHQEAQRVLVKYKNELIRMGQTFWSYSQALGNFESEDRRAEAEQNYLQWVDGFRQRLSGKKYGNAIVSVHRESVQPWMQKHPHSRQMDVDAELGAYQQRVEARISQLLKQEERRYNQEVESITNYFFEEVQDILELYTKYQVQKETLKKFILPLAERQQEQRSPQELIKTSLEKVLDLDHGQLMKVIVHSGNELSGSQLSCLCSNSGFLAHISTSYHPGPVEGWDKFYTCGRSGPPCVGRAFGCARRPLPSDPDIWRRCAPSAIETLELDIAERIGIEEEMLAEGGFDTPEGEDVATDHNAESYEKICF